ncbi:MAG: GGDEF domain-containing protein [Myxococcales bacterium]|nr:GGDEF domain-containing protein [Myxococcales bacterium]
MENRGAAGHPAFLLAVGAAGWVAIAWAIASGVASPGWGAVLFFGVALGTRALAFPLAGTEVSADAALFVVAALCLGPRVAALGVGVTLSADALWRVRRATGPGRSLLGRAAYVGYFGGMSGGLLWLVARLWGVQVGAGGPLGADAAWRVPALGVTFVAAHYTIQAVQLRLAGRGWRESVGRMLVGAFAEATPLPLAVVMAMVWDPARPLAAALLGGTYWLVAFGFSRLAQAKAALHRRVAELEALNRSARALGRTLDEGEQAEAVCAAAARALPAADRVTLVLCGPEAKGDTPVRCHRFERGRGAVSDGRTAAARPPARSEIVLPLLRFGEALGELRIEADAAGRLGADELRIAEAIAAQATAALENARLYALATVDGLTGLHTRRHFDARLDEEVERSHRFGTAFALLLLDLDDFKRINDRHGHLAGDRALRETARQVLAQLRGIDLAGRYGGEEVAIILPRTTIPDAVQVGERIRAGLAEASDGAVRVTVSIGVTGFVPGDDARALIGRADAALYRAKAHGKDRVEAQVTPQTALQARTRRLPVGVTSGP